MERLRLEKAEVEEQLVEAHAALVAHEADVKRLEETARREAEKSESERVSSAQLIEDLSKEVKGT